MPRSHSGLCLRPAELATHRRARERTTRPCCGNGRGGDGQGSRAATSPGRRRTRPLRTLGGRCVLRRPTFWRKRGEGGEPGLGNSYKAGGWPPAGACAWARRRRNRNRRLARRMGRAMRWAAFGKCEDWYGSCTRLGRIFPRGRGRRATGLAGEDRPVSMCRRGEARRQRVNRHDQFLWMKDLVRHMHTCCENWEEAESGGRGFWAEALERELNDLRQLCRTVDAEAPRGVGGARARQVAW